MRTAIVTGASRGIGRGIALDLAGQGFGLTISSRTRADLEAFATELTAAGAARVVVHPADLSDREAAAAVADVHRETFGSANALVLSGGMGTAGPIAELEQRRIDKILTVNLTSGIALIQRALPLLRAGAREDEAHGSRIIGLASITGAFAEPGLAVYGASKAALISLMETLNAEESADGVMATAIAPGYVDTDMAAWVTDTVPAETMMPVEDVVGVVRMLVGLGRRTSITRIVMTRSGTDGYRA